jgi:hypothetical protein
VCHDGFGDQENEDVIQVCCGLKAKSFLKAISGRPESDKTVYDMVIRRPEME